MVQPDGPGGLQGPGWRALPILSIQRIRPQKYISEFEKAANNKMHENKCMKKPSAEEYLVSPCVCHLFPKNALLWGLYLNGFSKCN